jgi:hypothetical protein
MPDGYTHDPEAFDSDGEYGPGTDSDEDPAEHARGAHPESADREFDWRGWTLVGAIFVSFLVVPGIIYLYPRVGPMFGLTFWDAYLALPMIPAVILGILAVWATTRP